MSEGGFSCAESPPSFGFCVNGDSIRVRAKAAARASISVVWMGYYRIESTSHRGPPLLRGSANTLRWNSTVSERASNFRSYESGCPKG